MGKDFVRSQGKVQRKWKKRGRELAIICENVRSQIEEMTDLKKK